MQKVQRVLITGSTGFLARYLISELKKEGNYDIFGITDEDFSSNLDQTYKVDIRDRQELFRVIKTVKPDKIFHLAAVTNVGFSWKNQKLTYEVNLLGSLNLFEGLCDAGLQNSNVLIMSSAEVYGNSPDTIRENTSLSIENPYSLSKYAMEMLADIFIKSNKMKIIKARAFNFTGPGQDKQFVSSDFAFQIAEIEKERKSPIIEVGNLSAMRDFSDVRDMARYIKTLNETGIAGKTYNLCSGEVLSIQDILDKLLSFSSRTIKVKIDKNKFRPVDIPVLKGDNTLIKKQFELFPKYHIDTTLKDILAFWRNNNNE